MKKLSMFVLCASFAGCVGAGDSPLRVTSSYPLTDACAQDTTIAQYAGSYDLAGVRQAGAVYAASYYSFTVSSDLSTAKIVANGQTLDDSSRNEIFVDNVVFDYTSDPAITFEEEVMPLHSAVAAGSDSNYFIIDLLAPKATQKLLDSVSPGGGAVTLKVKLKLQGTVNGREPIESNSVVFPITVYDSGQVCAAGSVVGFTGKCGSVGGQDGTAICVSADAGI